MKHIYALFLLLLIALPAFELRATHYMGGEISWECLSNGKYRFTMKLYRECYISNGSAAANFAQTETIQSNVPGIGAITMTRLTGYPVDISPLCNPDPSLPHIMCTGMVPPGNANMGALQEHIYTSDASYPNGVPLSGVPPASGWVFSNSSCCRNSSSNILGSNGMNWYLKAIMYPYNNQNTSTCFDNSPAFTERPIAAVSTAYPVTMVYTNTDLDGDSLRYSVTQPLSGSTQPITAYSAGYTWQSPLPDTTHSPDNVPLNLDPGTGLFSFTSFTQGAFVTSVKVTAYKSGIKVSETIREMAIIVRNPAYSNSPPRLISHATVNQQFIDTVRLGSTNNITIVFADSGLLPNNQRQSLSFHVSSDLLDTSNAPIPSFTPVSFSTTDTAGLLLSWSPQCKHWKGWPTEYLVYIRVSDDFCPFPATAFYTLKLVLVNDSALIAPKVCTNVTRPDLFGSNIVNVFWDPPADPLGLFQRYELYCKMPGGGIDTIYSSTNLQSSYYVHQSQTASNPLPHSYFLKVFFSGACDAGGMAGQPETTIKLSYLQLATDSIRLSWNNLPTATSYEIWSIDPNMMLNLEGTTTGTSYSLHLSSFSKQFMVRAIEAGQACHSGSNTVGPIALGIEDAGEDFQLFPNPTSGELILPAQFDGERVIVYNSLGRVVFDATATARINISHLESGIYFVSVHGKMCKILLIGN
jgi:hypothetical protein